MGLVIGGTHTETPPLQERQKLIHGESRLANDGVEGSARDVFALVQGNGGLVMLCLICAHRTAGTMSVNIGRSGRSGGPSDIRAHPKSDTNIAKHTPGMSRPTFF